MNEDQNCRYYSRRQDSSNREVQLLDIFQEDGVVSHVVEVVVVGGHPDAEEGGK